MVIPLTVFLITYDLNRETVRPPIVRRIRSYEAWARLSESSYAISTPQTAAQVYSGLSDLLDNNDSLFVIKLSNPASGWAADPDVKQWLDQHLTW